MANRGKSGVVGISDAEKDGAERKKWNEKVLA